MYNIHIMLIYDEKQKEYIYNWRKNNPEKFKEYMRKKSKEYYQKNRDKILQQKKSKRIQESKEESSSVVESSSSLSITLNPL